MIKKLIKTDEKGYIYFSKYYITRIPKGFQSRLKLFQALGFEVTKEKEWEKKGSYDTDCWHGIKSDGGHWHDLYKKTILKKSVEQAIYTIEVTQKRELEFKTGTWFIDNIAIHRSDRIGSYTFYKNGWHRIENYKCSWKKANKSNEINNHRISAFNRIPFFLKMQEKDLPERWQENAI